MPDCGLGNEFNAFIEPVSETLTCNLRSLPIRFLFDFVVVSKREDIVVGSNAEYVFNLRMTTNTQNIFFVLLGSFSVNNLQAVVESPSNPKTTRMELTGTPCTACLLADTPIIITIDPREDNYTALGSEICFRVPYVSIVFEGDFGARDGGVLEVTLDNATDGACFWGREDSGEVIPTDAPEVCFPTVERR